MTLGASPPASVEELALPVEYENGRTASLFYAIDARRARSFLPNPDVHPLVVAGKAAVSLAWFDYERSSLGSYRELSIGIVVDRERTLWRLASRFALGSAFTQWLTLGSYVLALPVTSPLARDAGVALAGLPKVLMELPLTWSKGLLDATALDEGRRVLSMSIPLGPGPTCPVPALVVYSQLKEQLLRTRVTTHFYPQMDWVGRPRLTVENAAHPLGELAHRLGLETAPCLGIAHGLIRSATLHAPELATK
jgi:hypothetical protein